MASDNQGNTKATVASNAFLVVALLGLAIAIYALLVDSAPNVVATIGFVISFIGWAALIIFNLRRAK